MQSFAHAPVLWLQETASTNSFLYNLLPSVPLEGTTIAAYHQTAGKGQVGTIWLDEAGKNLLCSTLFLPTWLHASKQVYFNMAMALAMYDLVSDYLPQTTFIKWPNDIWVDDLKIAGMLIECGFLGEHLQYAIVGMGINTNQAVFDQRLKATSLYLETGVQYQLSALLVLLRKHLFARYQQLIEEKYTDLKDAFMQSLGFLGIKRTFYTHTGSFDGAILDVDEMGRLVIDTPQGKRVFNNKEIQFTPFQ